MKSQSDRQQRQKIFAWVVLGCIILAVGYTLWVTLRADPAPATLQALPQGTALPIAQPDELEAIQTRPYLVFINQDRPYIGKVKLMGLDSAAPRAAQTALSCERVYYAAGNGICLAQDPSASFPLVLVTLFGSDFQPRHKFTIEGIASRARVSPDGRYAAFTVFATGHSYNDADMSTATILLDTATGASLGNLEEFETWKDGNRFQAPEFNFWGITFGRNSNQFYATLRNADTTYLVQGDVAARKLTVLRENVECPSLSPDGTRVAFKKRTLTGMWQLTVLDLATMQETPLAEEESIDDQLEWLDNDHVLYQNVDFNPPKWISLFVLPADGSGQPEVFIANATSPAAVRTENMTLP